MSGRDATDAMRLRPAARPRPGADPGVARERTAGAIDALEQQLAEARAALDAVLELHSTALAGLCRECITEHPCRTVRAAHPDPAPETPREDSTQ